MFLMRSTFEIQDKLNFSNKRVMYIDIQLTPYL